MRTLVAAALILALGACSDDSSAEDAGPPEASVDAALPDGPAADTAVPDAVTPDAAPPDSAVPDAPSALDLTGYWQGTWTSKGTLGGGSLSGWLTHAKASVSGKLAVGNNPVIVNGALAGTLEGTQLTATLTSGLIVIDARFSVAPSGQSMKGTYSTFGDSGAMSLWRATPPDAGASD